MERLVLPKSLYLDNSQLVHHIIWGGKPVMRQMHDTDATIALPKGYARYEIGRVADCGNGLVSVAAY